MIEGKLLELDAKRKAALDKMGPLGRLFEEGGIADAGLSRQHAHDFRRYARPSGTVRGRRAPYSWRVVS